MMNVRGIMQGAVIGLLIAGIVVVVGCLFLIQPFFEARAYNRITGAHVSTWDAVWLDLRVQESPK